jgi:hypothetical protein
MPAALVPESPVAQRAHRASQPPKSFEEWRSEVTFESRWDEEYEATAQAILTDVRSIYRQALLAYREGNPVDFDHATCSDLPQKP